MKHHLFFALLTLITWDSGRSFGVDSTSTCSGRIHDSRLYNNAADAAPPLEVDAPSPRPVALVTGVSRSIGIGNAIAQRLSKDGFQVVAAGWTAYDERMPWGADKQQDEIFDHFYSVNLEDPVATRELFPQVIKDVGGQAVSVLVLCHCESVDSDIFTTTVESFDRHYAVNARATWQLIQGLANQYKDIKETPQSQLDERESHPPVRRILSITSDHTAGNLPYGASKGAMDRIVLAAAEELKELGITSNVINPGATDTGWMTSPELKEQILARNLSPRIGQPSDVANLVSFLCSEQGQWINGQILYSDGGRTR